MSTGSAYDLLFELGIKTPRYASSPVYSDRNEILNSKIYKIFVFISGPDKGADALNFASCSEWLLPARVSLCNVKHASIIAETYESGLILIEYGAYGIYREGDYRGKIHYYEGSDGLRFIQMTQEDIERAEGKKGNYFVYCDVKYHMTINEMLRKTKYQGSYHQWDKDNYNLFAQNCQLFVRKAIQVLGATRESEKQKNRVAMKCVIPFRILNALEDNEDDPERIVEKIPIIGQIYGLIKAVSE